ncbi:MAG: ABC transporter ATP-binding protein [Methanomassiliicoccales archaeon]|nr:MAG: ABC transporter ATP-binding protein [Methanomassiliicoccales archaeon]
MVILKYIDTFSSSRGIGMPNDPIIVVKELTKVYEGDIVAADHVSFEVKRGEIFSLLGPNGAGKTTTVEMMEGLRTPTSGDIRIFGVDVNKDYASIRHRVGVLPQEFEPFDRLKPPETISYFAGLFGKKMTDEQVTNLLKTVGLDNRAKSLSMKLSGGEKRRLGIALALVGDAELLFLDEPTTGLDPQARRSLWKLLEGLRDEGRTILLTTHYLEEAERLADDVAVMHLGKIIARGSPEELMDKFGGGISILLRGCGEEALSRTQALGFKVEQVKGDLKVDLAPGDSVREAIRRLDASDVPFKDLITIEPTLEEAFLNLVGSKMEGGVLKQ